MLDIKKYILDADDLELVDKNRLLIVTKKRKILLNGLSIEFIDKCYEIFGERFRKNKTNEHLKVIWSDSEIHYLRENYLKKSIEEIGVEVGKSAYQINLMLGKLKLIVKKEWSKPEIEFLQDNIDESTIWLAGKLKRSVASIKSKKRVLKLLKI